MQELRDDPEYQDTKTCHLLTALTAAVQIQKKKVISGPNDAVGIMLFNTVRPKASCSLYLSSNRTTLRPGRQRLHAFSQNLRRILLHTNPYLR